MPVRVVELTSDGLNLCFGSVSGREYIVEQADALSDDRWHEVPLASLPGNGERQCFAVNRPMGTHAFYRLKLR